MISPETQKIITDEILYTLGGKLDGARKNILATCPNCHDERYKFGVYVGPNANRKFFGSSHCFHCGVSYRTLNDTLKAIGRDDLLIKETTKLDDEDDDFDTSLFEDEIDDSLVEIKMPKGYKRCFKNAYLKSRGWLVDDFMKFPVGTNRGFEREYSDYVILEVIDDGKLVGFVARSVLSKDEIDLFNRRHTYQIRRYKNSNENEGNGFAKLLYNYDSIEPMATHSVILCEGPFDVVALNRKLELYENKSFVPVATFGKKISQEQMFKLQKKGVEQVVIGYDNDAKETTSRIAMELEKYFDVLIADIPSNYAKDWDEMSLDEVVDVFTYDLKTVREFNLD